MVSNTQLHDADSYIGGRVKFRRQEVGMSQTKLGELVGGISFQQIQKYEKGTNRIGGSRLMAMSRALGVPISYFFAGLEGPETPVDPLKGITPYDLDLARKIHSLPRSTKAAVEQIVGAVG